MHLLWGFDGLRQLSGPVAAAFGVFDGLHRGHCELIQSVISRAQQIGAVPVVVTFDPHPLKVLAPQNAPKILMALPHKLRVLAKMKVEFVAVFPFDKELACMTPEEFIGKICSSCRIQLIGVGYRWAFGHNRAGNVPLLRELGRQYQFNVFEMEPVSDQDGVISSTRVRQAVEEGRLDKTRLMLGRDFSIFAPVVKGEGRGNRIGFPTANLQPESEVLPPYGVYAARAELEDGSAYPAAVHCGPRPTVSAGASLEAHLVGFQGDLLGRYLELYFKEKIRDVTVFRNESELASQIQADVTRSVSLAKSI